MANQCRANKPCATGHQYALHHGYSALHCASASSAKRQDYKNNKLITKIALHHTRIQPVLLHQLTVFALLNNTALIENNNVIGMLYR